MRRLLQAWVLGCLLLGGAALGKEAYTVGYAVDEGSFERLARGDWANVDRDSEEVFGPPRKIEFTVAVPAKAPLKSRFFGKGDELLAVTGQMREAKVLTLDASWAVYNRTQRRLVLFGHAVEHSRFVMLWQAANERLPKLISGRS